MHQRVQGWAHSPPPPPTAHASALLPARTFSRLAAHALASPTLLVCHNKIPPTPQAPSLSWTSGGAARAAARRCSSASPLPTPPSAAPWPTRAGESMAPGCTCVLTPAPSPREQGVDNLASTQGGGWLLPPARVCTTWRAPLLRALVRHPLLAPVPIPPGRIMLCYWWFTYCILVRKQPRWGRCHLAGRRPRGPGMRARARCCWPQHRWNRHLGRGPDQRALAAPPHPHHPHHPHAPQPTIAGISPFWRHHWHLEQRGSLVGGAAPCFDGAELLRLHSRWLATRCTSWLLSSLPCLAPVRLPRYCRL